VGRICQLSYLGDLFKQLLLSAHKNHSLISLRERGEHQKQANRLSLEQVIVGLHKRSVAGIVVNAGNATNAYPGLRLETIRGGDDGWRTMAPQKVVDIISERGH
jgi:hypothetical protein